MELLDLVTEISRYMASKGLNDYSMTVFELIEDIEKEIIEEGE